jgi:hypothetical protein
MATEMLHTDRQTDKTKLIIAFCNFANAPENTKTTILRIRGTHNNTRHTINSLQPDMKIISPLPMKHTEYILYTNKASKYNYVIQQNILITTLVRITKGITTGKTPLFLYEVHKNYSY